MGMDCMCCFLCNAQRQLNTVTSTCCVLMAHERGSAVPAPGLDRAMNEKQTLCSDFKGTLTPNDNSIVAR